jgi:hypothetical protein
MQTFLQGRIDLVKSLRDSSLPVTAQDLELILTAVMSACAACRWPGEGFDRRRFVESLVRFSPPELHVDWVSTSALLELSVISDSQTPWGVFGQEIRIFTGEEIDGPIPVMAERYRTVSVRDLKKASYANRIYEWLRCGYAHIYWGAGNTTHVPPSDRPAQISYIGRRERDGSLSRIASFHLDYLIQVAQEQVSTLPNEKLDEPTTWWIDQAEMPAMK